MTTEVTMTTWIASDGFGETVEIDAETSEEAARKYVDDSDFPESDRTAIHNVHVAPKDDPDGGERIRVLVHPKAPPCYSVPDEDEDGYTFKRGRWTRDAGHDWEDEGGPRGHGGGVIYTERCPHCGVRKVTDTWGQDPLTGEQGIRVISYERG